MTKDWPNTPSPLTVGGARAAGQNWLTGLGAGQRLLSAGEWQRRSRRRPRPGGRLRGPAGPKGPLCERHGGDPAARPGTARLDMAMARSSQVGRRHGPGLPGALLRPAACAAAHGAWQDGLRGPRPSELAPGAPGTPSTDTGRQPRALAPAHPCSWSFLTPLSPSQDPSRCPPPPTQRPFLEPPQARDPRLPSLLILRTPFQALQGSPSHHPTDPPPANAPYPAASPGPLPPSLRIPPKTPFICRPLVTLSLFSLLISHPWAQTCPHPQRYQP